MEDEIVDLKSVSGKYTNNNNDKSNSRKNYIINYFSYV